MSAGARQKITIDTLSAALAAGRFPTSVASRAQDLLDRLNAPARITLFGMPQVGKTGVLNLLAGGAVAPDNFELGTVRVEYGPNNKTHFTFADGKTLAMDAAPDPVVLAKSSPMLTHIHAPLPALQKITLLEISLKGDANAQARAIKWADKQTDIAIWCINEFSPQEMALWQTTPDRLRDHGILLHTRADLLGERRSSAVSRLWDAAGDEFAYALDVSVREANNAAAQGTVDKAMMRASGGMKLISTILKEIETARQNMIDQADVLLRMHPEVDVKALASQDVAQEIKQTAPKEVAVETTQAPKSAPAPEPEAAPEPKASQPAPSDTVVVTFQAAADRLAKVGLELQENDAPDTDAILDASAHALEWLGQHLEEADLPDEPRVKIALSMAQDAEDLVQLLRIEGSDSGTTGAILALLQLKRGFQAALAA